jgi:hypothetical protein
MSIPPALHFACIPLYKSPASIATIAAPAGTPKLLASPWKLLAVALAALSAAVPVELPVAVALAAVEACDCVAATLATEAMEAEAEARRGAAAWQYEVTVFCAVNLVGSLGQLL